MKCLVCARKLALFTALWPVIQSLRQTVRSDVRVTNESFFCEQVESVHQIWLKLLNQFTARAAQIYKLLNQISLSDAWRSLRLEIRHNSGVSDPAMNESFSAPVPQTVIELRKQFDSDRRPMSRWYAHVWTEHLHEGTKLKFLWFLIVYVKRWADEDKLVHFICFRHVKHPHFT